MGKLIANVRVDTVVDGKRVSIAAGEEVTGLSAHDARELKLSGLIYDEADEARAVRERKQDEREARAEFEAERQAVIEARESTQVPETDEKSKTE
ncbi:hypothetical protein [Burkholderia orbicola]|uniref:hypothetical protein n=1 Tax=Burkholderia orbicola TaxID=2978683 RepID=UPI0026501D8D|nr:hypothetical protein [Burkholderia orbicola]MDN7533858.1 hypothetical protein [Burkholderia orbicola]